MASSPATPTPETPVPIGRLLETERLRRNVQDVSEGRKRGVSLVGEPGVGKTTLLRWTHDLANRAGMLTSVVRAPAAAGLPPRFPIGQLVEGLFRACSAKGIRAPEPLAKVLAALSGGMSDNAYPAHLPQIADALESAAAINPIALFIDDYHWAPVEATTLITRATRCIESPVLLVAALRQGSFKEGAPSEPPASTADLPTDIIELGPLTNGHLAQLTDQMLGGPPLPSLLRLLQERTRGNPLFLIECLRSWQANGSLVNTGGYWGLEKGAELHEPGSLRAMIAARVSQLTTVELDLCATLAVLGREGAFDFLQATSDLQADELIRTLSRLVENRVITTDSQEKLAYRLDHPLYENFLLSTLGRTKCSLIHGRIYSALNRMKEQGRSVTWAQLAHHAAQALVAPGDLLEVITAAADEADSVGSAEEVAHWYGQLASLVRDDRSRLAEALEKQATAASQFDPELSRQLLSTTMTLVADSSTHSRMLLKRAHAYRILGNFEAAASDLKSVLMLGKEDDLLEARHGLAVLSGIQGRVDEAEAGLSSLLKDLSSTHQVRPKVMGHLGQVAFSKGDLFAALSCYEAALAAEKDSIPRFYLCGNLSWILTLVGRWNEARSLLSDSIEEAETAGDAWNLVTLYVNLARLQAWRGNSAEGMDLALRALRTSKRLTNPAALVDALEALGVVLLESDRQHEARKTLQEACGLASEGIEPRELSHTFSVLAEAQISCGDYAGAKRSCAIGRDYLSQAGLWRIALDRIEASIESAVGDRLLALDILDPWVHGELIMPFEHGKVLLLSAEISNRLGRKTVAYDLASKAYSTFLALEATRYMDHASSLTDAIQAPQKGRPKSTRPFGVTDREVEVIRLLADGWSTPQIAGKLVLSPRTTKKHVENAKGKLGVSRIGELVAVATRLGIIER